MDDRAQLDPTFFSVPLSDWHTVDAETLRGLAQIHRMIGRALADAQQRLPDPGPAENDAPDSNLPPAQLALQMHEVAGGLMAHAAADEQDLRQIISTLRTGLAVCWDLYSVRESERVTVAEHMLNLRTRIEDFERDLLAIQRRKTASLTPHDAGD